MRNEAADLPVVELDGEYHTLIPSRFPPIAVYERIAGGRDDEFAAVEALTNPRLREKDRLTRGLAPVDQQQPRFVNWNHAPFAYPNPEGSRFFGPERNVMELAADLQTALAVCVARREAFLGRTAEPATALEVRQLLHPLRGRFVDARSWDGDSDRESRLKLGAAVAEGGHDGVLFSPAERPSATAACIVNPACLGRPKQGEHFKLVWNGERITVLYSFRAARPLDPAALALPEAVHAA